MMRGLAKVDICFGLTFGDSGVYARKRGNQMLAPLPLMPPPCSLGHCAYDSEQGIPVRGWQHGRLEKHIVQP